MPTIRTAIPIQTGAAVSSHTGQARIPRLYHVAAAAWIVGMLGLARIAPFDYERILQEDGFVEWLTVALFAAAAFFRVRNAWPQRRVFDLLVAAFCIFVAGEEFSWGQRLLGFTPPDVFLEHNTQQEFTLHNFADVFGKPKGVLILALIGYGVVLPLLSRWKHLERLGATPPPPTAIPWFVTAAVLLVWYPADFTGEWVEALAASAFLVSVPLGARPLFATTAIASAATALLTWYSANQVRASPASLACAQREAHALANDIGAAGATQRLRDRDGTVHKRVLTAVTDGYLDPAALSSFQQRSCGQASRHFIDPWAMAYWLRYDPDTREVMVYSMGPNRRRDALEDGTTPGDDIIARATLPD